MGGRGASSRIGRHGGGVGAGGSGSGTGGVTGGGGGGVVGGGGGATGGTGGGGVGGGGGAGGMPGTQASTAQQQGRFERPGEPLSNKYKGILERKFNDASPEMQKVYDKYVPKGGAVTDLHSSDVGQFRHATNDIILNQSEDSDGRGKEDGSVWFHEHGHYVDFNAHRPSLSPEYWDRLQRDVYNIETRWLTQHGYSRADLGTKISEDQMRSGIALELNRNSRWTHGIQDVLEGINPDYEGKVFWGHGSKYWTLPSRRAKVPVEAWAHMFDAAFDKKVDPYMRTYFPESYDWFMQIVVAI